MIPKPARPACHRSRNPNATKAKGRRAPRTKSPSSPLLPFPPELPAGPGSPYYVAEPAAERAAAVCISDAEES